MFRKALFWFHLAAGVVAGPVILLMSVTGVLLTYERQISAWEDSRISQAVQTGAAPPSLSLDKALHTATEAGSGAANRAGTPNVILRSGAAPVSISFDKETLLIDPSTGRVLASGDTPMRGFFRRVKDWHRWLGVAAGAPDGARAKAKTLTGAANLCFLFLVVSGLFLWFPRVWRWQNVRAVTWFRAGLSGKARDFNWHNTAGFWCCVPLFFIVLSGVAISYPWASDSVYRLNGVEAPAPGKGGGREKGRADTGRRAKGEGKRATVQASTENLETLLAQVQRRWPSWNTISFQIPGEGVPVTFNVDEGSGGQPQKRFTSTLARTGEVLRTESFGDRDAGRRARSWFRFAHTGEYYGIAGQTIAGLASAGGALLVWTGLALAYRRLRASLKRRGLARPDASQTPDLRTAA